MLSGLRPIIHYDGGVGVNAKLMAVTLSTQVLWAYGHGVSGGLRQFRHVGLRRWVPGLKMVDFRV